MEIILLSGGSGKRLWPLSNNARSKQFLQLLEKPGGGMESMVQRVVRQILEAHLTENITIATNESQSDIILNQLGRLTGLVTEPERRDTFPAIALAASYLALEKHCSPDETVVVMPCDPYTEAGYFETIRYMAEAVESGVAEMVLMGITPTYPSTKFGYVVPVAKPDAGSHKPVMVRRFTEKPSAEKAAELLEEGALWNGGIFAFKLGYMMRIVRKYLNHDSFAEIRSDYGKFPKISFDYEVAEKASSVAVIAYNGEWKDLGTWNSLTAELSSATIGNAKTGPDCNNVHAINELDIPMFVNGISDAVVAASPDGILVCGKEYSETIKSHVESFQTRPMFEERRWGTYRVLDYKQLPDGVCSLTKVINIESGRNTSYQRHLHSSETITVIDGEGILVHDGVSMRIGRGDAVTIRSGELHGFRALTSLTYIEVQIGELSEDDIERLDFDWNSILA
ncbi:MAG: cupin domain-containing protein [Bacteroidaceae bacterium]|nr:cupin domain-containing protein [Bacteroidaceae bacterium]